MDKNLFSGKLNQMLDEVLLEWQNEEIEELLDLAISDIQKEVIDLRQSAFALMICRKDNQKQYDLYQEQAQLWKQRVEAALDEDLDDQAQDALKQKKAYTEKLNQIKSKIEQIDSQLTPLRKKITDWKCKIQAANETKAELISKILQIRSSQPPKQLLSYINISGTSTAFEQIEKKVIQAEKLINSEIKNQLLNLESASDLDAELVVMKAQLILQN
jgi:phage shock protein A